MSAQAEDARDRDAEIRRQLYTRLTEDQREILANALDAATDHSMWSRARRNRWMWQSAVCRGWIVGPA